MLGRGFRSLALPKQTERPGVELHHFVEVSQKISQAVIARISVIFVSDMLPLQLRVQSGRAFFESVVIVLAAVEINCELS